VGTSCEQVVRVSRRCREDARSRATAAFLAELGRIAGGKATRTVGDDVERPERNGVLVTDVLFVLVMLAVFGLLALVTKGAEKL
jgi:hypothetical protein